MRRGCWLGLWLCLPAACQAAEGAWHASSAGPGLINRGVQITAPALSPPQLTTGTITEVAWRYRLTAAAPGGLQVWLCASDRCVALEGGSGRTRGLSNVAAGETLRFIYRVNGKGRSGVQVLSNEVMVNYR